MTIAYQLKSRAEVSILARVVANIIVGIRAKASRKDRPNVEKAIVNLKTAKVLTPKALSKISEKNLAKLISPAGYYNINTTVIIR